MRPVAVVGPTATGKSDLAIDLAAEFGGAVVNADAMQLYRGMDIGTAKVPVHQRRGIDHHLLDVLDVTETASVAAYQRQACDLVERLPMTVLCGGSGLYVQSVVDDLRFPGTDPAVRAELEREAADVGAEQMHRRLQAADPAAAAAILPSNVRRVVRALEVIAITGEPFSANLPTPGPPRFGIRMIGIDRDPAELDDRVAARVHQMFADGLVAEVERLAEQGLRDGKTASRALGYQQVLAALDGGGDMDRAAEETIVATRRFVRRQRSWFRRDKRIMWLNASEPGLTERVLDAVR